MPACHNALQTRVVIFPNSSSPCTVALGSSSIGAIWIRSDYRQPSRLMYEPSRALGRSLTHLESDATATQALKYSKAPVIWSRSFGRLRGPCTTFLVMFLNPDKVLRLVGTVMEKGIATTRDQRMSVPRPTLVWAVWKLKPLLMAGLMLRPARQWSL